MLFSLKQLFSIRDNFTFEETFDSTWRHFWLLQFRACYGHLGAEGRDAAKRPVMYRTVLHSSKLSDPKC